MNIGSTNTLSIMAYGLPNSSAFIGRPSRGSTECAICFGDLREPSENGGSGELIAAYTCRPVKHLLHKACFDMTQGHVNMRNCPSCRNSLQSEQNRHTPWTYEIDIDIDQNPQQEPLLEAWRELASQRRLAHPRQARVWPATPDKEQGAAYFKVAQKMQQLNVHGAIRIQHGTETIQLDRLSLLATAAMKNSKPALLALSQYAKEHNIETTEIHSMGAIGARLSSPHLQTYNRLQLIQAALEPDSPEATDYNAKVLLEISETLPPGRSIRWGEHELLNADQCLVRSFFMVPTERSFHLLQAKLQGNDSQHLSIGGVPVTPEQINAHFAPSPEDQNYIQPSILERREGGLFPQPVLANQLAMEEVRHLLDNENVGEVRALRELVAQLQTRIGEMDQQMRSDRVAVNERFESTDRRLESAEERLDTVENEREYFRTQIEALRSESNNRLRRLEQTTLARLDQADEGAQESGDNEADTRGFLSRFFGF